MVNKRHHQITIRSAWFFFSAISYKLLFSKEKKSYILPLKLGCFPTCFYREISSSKGDQQCMSKNGRDHRALWNSCIFGNECTCIHVHVHVYTKDWWWLSIFSVFVRWYVNEPIQFHTNIYYIDQSQE